MPKYLFTLRHADAQADKPASGDKDRTLSLRGFRQLDQFKDVIKSELSQINMVLCSNTKRTRQTLDGIRSLLPDHVEFLFHDSLYTANPDQYMNLLKQMSDKHTHVLIVGHNPGMTDFYNVIHLCEHKKQSHDVVDPATLCFYESTNELNWKKMSLSDWKCVKKNSFEG
jgi:phosphohistidine phosphatase